MQSSRPILLMKPTTMPLILTPRGRYASKRGDRQCGGAGKDRAASGASGHDCTAFRPSST